MSEDDDSCSSKDRLSNLPNAVLITILSFLPVHSAAATSILAWHWRYLWTQITRVYIRFPSDRSFQANVDTVDKEIMPKLKSPMIPLIRTFNLKLSSRDLSRLNVSSLCLVPWLKQICGPNLTNVQVNLGGISTFFTRLYQIPICIFQCQSLVKLYLHGNLYFGFFDDDDPTTTITLPYLKKLALDLSNDHDIASIGLLFAACPLLEVLNLTLSSEKNLFLCFTENDQIVVNLSIPKLKSLCLDVEATNGEGSKIVIDAPNLKTCHIKGPLSYYDFVTIPENLQRVVISIKKTPFGDDSDYITKISGLIRGISCVADLTLEESGLQLLDSISRLDGPLPIFHNLSVLSLRIDDWIGELPGSFFLGNLEVVCILDVRCEDVEINLVQHILTNATTLEGLLVRVHNRYSDDEDQDQKEYDFCRKLFKLARSSVNCLIRFVGTAGVLTFRIKDDSDSDSDDTVETYDSD